MADPGSVGRVPEGVEMGPNLQMAGDHRLDAQQGTDGVDELDAKAMRVGRRNDLFELLEGGLGAPLPAFEQRRARDFADAGTRFGCSPLINHRW